MPTIKQIEQALKAGGDLGGKTVNAIIKAHKEGTEPTADPLTLVIYNAMNGAEDIEEAVNTMEYAISQIKAAKISLESFNQ